MSEFYGCCMPEPVLMLNKFRNRLENLLAPDDTADSAEQSTAATFAATALLIEAAQADSELSDDELTQIKNSLSSQFGIRVNEVEQTLLGAHETLDAATCLYEITNIVNRDWSLNQKIHLIEAMWKVVLSDNYLDPNENHLMRKIKGLLYIPQAEYINAKIRAQSGL